MKKYKSFMFLLLFIFLVFIYSSWDTFSPGPLVHNKETYWFNSFEYSQLEDAVNKTLVSNYPNAFPVGEYWTYTTRKPKNATLDILNYKMNKYLNCSVLSAQKGITSKAQVVRKFPPYGIDDSYQGITSIYPGDTVVISFQIFMNDRPNGNVYFLDLEDSTSRNRGIRFLIDENYIGVNIDKLSNKNPLLYVPTDIPVFVN
jgi:hypothetical protein